MISKNTATDIALAYREIEVAEKLLTEVVEAMSRHEAPDVRDAFGRRRNGLELGVPTSDTSRRMFDVPWNLAKPIIEAHIASKKALLSALTEKARGELDDPRDPSPVAFAA